MAKVSLRDLRTRFPHVRALIEREGEVVITDRGKAILVLRPIESVSSRPRRSAEYFARLKRLQPDPIGSAVQRGLDEANRGDR